MKKVGYLHHESLQALCGNDALNSNSGITEGNLTIGTEGNLTTKQGRQI